MNAEELMKELKKFPPETPITVYEGKFEGITMGGVGGKYGFIYTEDDKPTELLS